jgi:hypothetical protein
MACVRLIQIRRNAKHGAFSRLVIKPGFRLNAMLRLGQPKPDLFCGK